MFAGPVSNAITSSTDGARTASMKVETIASAAGVIELFEQTLRNERAKLRRNIRRWQQACDQDDSEPGGLTVAIEDAERKLAELPGRLERLRKSGLKKRSRTDEDARFLRTRRGFELGYTGELAMSEDHLVVAQRVTQETSRSPSTAGPTRN